MKILKTTDVGGFPFVLDDIRFIYSGLLEAYRAVVSPYLTPQDVVILSGCEQTISGGSLTLSDGWIFYAGEIYNTIGGSWPHDPLKSVHYEVTVGYTPAGLKTFQNGQQYNTYENRFLHPVYTDTPPVNSFPRPMRTVISAIYEKMQSYTVGPINVSHQAIPSWELYPGTYDVVAYKDFSGVVHLSGSFWFEDPSPDHFLFQLPIDFRPSSQRILTAATVQAGVRLVVITIDPNGDVKYIDALPSAQYNNVISFDGIAYVR